MSPGNIDEPQTTSYKFQDANDSVVITLYANGAFEQKDIEVSLETDSLDVHTPTGERWVFELFAHIHSDQSEVKAEINALKTQTIIEFRLYKQQSRMSWPQLYSYKSIPITPQRNDQNVNIIIDPSNEQEFYELSMKKLRTNFSEVDAKVISTINIEQVHDCQVEFTETNFTAIFNTNDVHFLQIHSIPSKVPLKLFVRVKERIIPEQCSHQVTSTCIQITLIKDNPNGISWNRLEPSEYSQSRPPIQLITPSILSLPSTNVPIINISNKAIPLPPPQSLSRPTDYQSDKYSSTHQKDITHTLHPSASLGYTGIYNPANSCFMNAAIQCLSNTRELRDYFLQSYYVLELNRTNPLGMKGVMAEEFATTIQHLWSGKFSYIIANRLRDFAAQRHQEFVGNGQHDAQELLTIVLDAIHEDLNRVVTKPQIPPVEDENRPDYVIADEYWRGYLTRNDSIIVQLFTGQFKSKTKCPQCQKESVTFDPFTSLSVPLPKRISLDIIVIFRSDEKSPTKYRIIMSADGSIEEMKRLLSAKCGLPVAKMLAYKIRNNRVIEQFKDDDRASTSSYSWNSFDIIYVTEILTSAECNNETIIQLTFVQRVFKIPDFISSCEYCNAPPNPHKPPKFCLNCYQVSYCDEQCQQFHESDHKTPCKFRSGDNYDIVGQPFIISLPESKLTCEHVFEQISIYAKRSVDINIERSKQTRRSLPSNKNLNRAYIDLDDYETEEDEDDEDDSFDDIENVDWSTIKSTLSSSDSWSICRIGDYFVRTDKNKRRHNQQNERKEKSIKILSTNTNDDETMIISDDNDSNSSNIGDFDMLEDIFGSQSLFRIMPQTSEYTNNNVQSIIERGDDSDHILRCYTTFSIDWFTDNKMEASLRVLSSKNRSGINDLTEDDSVFKSFNGDQDVTLQQCLQLFIEPEVLGPDDKWYCPHCKEHIQAEKKMSVWRLPPILIIHLKRFKYNQCSSFGYMSSSREKIDTTIKFPIHDLNMAPYCSSVSEENQDLDNSSQSRYDLYGIINHRGTAWFGHYTSYARLLAYNDSAKTDIGWRNFDDERVTTLTNVKDLIRSDAYVLFYRHRNSPVNLVIQERLQSLLTESTNM